LLQNIGSLMEQMQRVQQALGEKKIEVGDPAGIFRVFINGRQELAGVEFDPAALRPERLAELQGVVTAVFNRAVAESKQMVKTEIAKMTQEMNLPNLPGIF